MTALACVTDKIWEIPKKIKGVLSNRGNGSNRSGPDRSVPIARNCLLASASSCQLGAPQPGALVRFYNKRNTAEQWIKESKQAVALTRLSCHRFRANEERLWLSLIAYNLGNLWRRLALPAPSGSGRSQACSSGW